MKNKCLLFSLLIITTFLAVMLLAGCSGGANSIVLSPEINQAATQDTPAIETVATTEASKLEIPPSITGELATLQKSSKCGKIEAKEGVAICK